MNAGVVGDEHKHDVEHCWYILSGKGTMTVDGKSFRVEPDMAVFAPADKLHKIVVDPDQDLTYIVIYALRDPNRNSKTR